MLATQRLRKWLGFGIALLAALLIGVRLHGDGALAAAQPPADPQVISEQFDGWAYQAALDDTTLSIIVNYDKLTPEGIKAFGEANRKLVDQVDGVVQASVVFQRPLSVQEFEGLVQQNRLSVESYILRAIDSTGGRITIQGAPDNDELVPQQMLRTILNNVDSHLPGTAFKGIVAAEIRADQAQLKQLLTDNRVFTTEVARAVATKRARAQVAAQNPDRAEIAARSRLSAPLYWFMESTGVAGE